MKKSIASLKERLSDWKEWDMAAYELGVCLGFWGDFGAPPGHDPWHGVKGYIWSSSKLGNSLFNFLDNLVSAGILERKEDKEIIYRWNPNFKEI